MLSIVSAVGILDFLSPVVAPDQHGSASAGWPARTQHVKVAVFGRSGVGKTSTVARLCGGGEQQYLAILHSEKSSASYSAQILEVLYESVLYIVCK